MYSKILALFSSEPLGTELYPIAMQTYENLFERRDITQRDRLCLRALVKNHPWLTMDDVAEIIDWWEML
ncbi:hypothetical protein VpaJT1_16 [Vibrio phage VpaJT_1]|nr:hypothetical protein VpaJT1_16 [Vibrio phage VpaJT_1]